MWIVMGIAGVMILVLILVLISIRRYNYRKNYVGTNDGIDEERYVELNGQEQYLLIKGSNVENPVLLYLHGGPACPDSVLLNEWAPCLTDKYTIVAWDQRGCGNTYYRNKAKDPENKTATFQQALKDLDALVDYLCEWLGHKKVIIMGHSYGTLLGIQYVQKYPQKVSHYVGVSQLISLKAGETVSYEKTCKILTDKGKDTEKLTAAYESYMQNVCAENMVKFRKQVIPYLQLPKARNTIVLGIMSPYLRVNFVRWQLLLMTNRRKFEKLNAELMNYTYHANLLEESLEYHVPITLIHGTCDCVTPPECSREYLKQIVASGKEIVTLENCVHSPQFDRPKEFAEVLKKAIHNQETM